MPPASITSASESFATHTPRAPASSKRCASTGLFSVSRCGRTETAASAKSAMKRVMLRSIAATSTSMAGVSIASR